MLWYQRNSYWNTIWCSYLFFDDFFGKRKWRVCSVVGGRNREWLLVLISRKMIIRSYFLKNPKIRSNFASKLRRVGDTRLTLYDGTDCIGFISCPRNKRKAAKVVCLVDNIRIGNFGSVDKAFFLYKKSVYKKLSTRSCKKWRNFLYYMHLRKKLPNFLLARFSVYTHYAYHN